MNLDLQQYPVLTAEAEAALISLLPNEAAAEQLVMRSLANAVRYLNRVCRGSLEESALLSISYAALCKSVRNVKPAGARFIPYSKIYLRGALFAQWKKNSREPDLIDKRPQETSEDLGLDTADHPSEGFGFESIHLSELWAVAKSVIDEVLTPHEKTVLRLVFELNYRYRDVAKFVGSSETAAHDACMRALRKVRLALAEQHALSSTDT